MINGYLDANSVRYSKWLNEGGFYNTINYWLVGIPDTVVDFVNGNGERGAAFVKDPSLFTVIDFVTAGTATEVKKAFGLPLSDPGYWGILYDICVGIIHYLKR